MTTEHELLKAQEVADLLRTSKMTVYRMIKTGQLDAIQVGRSYRVKRSSVNAVLSGSVTEAR
jgi:excisionase family DNA binding protein